MGAPPSSFDFFQRREQVVPSTVAWRPSGAAGLSRTFTSALAESEPDALLTVNTNLPANFFVTLSINRYSNYVWCFLNYIIFAKQVSIILEFENGSG